MNLSEDTAAIRFNKSVLRVTQIQTTETGETISVTIYRKKREKKKRYHAGLCGMKFMRMKRCD